MRVRTFMQSISRDHIDTPYLVGIRGYGRDTALQKSEGYHAEPARFLLSHWQCQWESRVTASALPVGE